MRAARKTARRGAAELTRRPAPPPPQGETALHYASAEGHDDVVATLLEEGAKTSADALGRTPAMLCVAGGHTESLRLLCHHAQVAEHEATKLLVAATERGDYAVVNVLQASCASAAALAVLATRPGAAPALREPPPPRWPVLRRDGRYSAGHPGRYGAGHPGAALSALE